MRLLQNFYLMEVIKLKRDKWASRSTFILAAVGSAVGLGNAWRFPGLAAKHGGGAFLLVYLVALLVFGVPLLMMEIAIGRKVKKGAPGALGSMKRGFEPIGWAATANAFVIVCYYAVVFAWVILMCAFSWKFANMTGDSVAASNLFGELTQTTWDVTGLDSVATYVVLALLIAWGLIWFCIRDGASSVGKVVKFTVFAPVVCLVIMAVKGFTMPGAVESVIKFFVPDFSALTNSEIWSDAVGQVFYSLSIMMAIMFAYGSFLDRKSNIAVDAIIIAVSDMAISILAGIVMFATMGGVGMTDNITDSGIATAFLIYPQAIVNLTDIGWLNAVFGLIFYVCLATLAIDSAFSIVEGISTAISDKFGIDKKKTTAGIIVIAGLISLVFITKAGIAYLDIVDYWANSVNLIVIGILECIAVGWFFKTTKVLDEVNRNTKKFKMPKWWFNTTIKFVAPALLIALFTWNMYTLFDKKGGIYGYTAESEFIAGWCNSIFVFASGIIIILIGAISRRSKKLTKWDNIVDEDEEVSAEPVVISEAELVDITETAEAEAPSFEETNDEKITETVSVE